MDWIQEFDLFLFDFDGLLVNTEHLHYTAYKELFSRHGAQLDWDFTTYCLEAHFDVERFRTKVFEILPELSEQGLTWEVLYPEKKAIYLDLLLQQGKVELMPGVETFLKELAKANKPRCVVTHSPSIHIEQIKEMIPVLKTIPLWFTRETYKKAKPDPECYLKAIHHFGAENKKVIGFEDSPRGFSALKQSQALPILITQVEYPDKEALLEEKGHLFSSFEDLFERFNTSPA